MFLKNKDYSFLKFECFNEHAKTILICVKQWAYKLCNSWKIFQKMYNNSNYYVSFVIFQTYKNTI
jgi:hypothetical protein